MSNVDIVKIIWIIKKFTLKLERKSEAAIIAPIFPLHIGSIVANIIPITMPAKIPLLGRFLRINQRFHTHIVQAIRFEQINNVKSIFDILPGVGDWEIIPLGVAVCIIVGR